MKTINEYLDELKEKTGSDYKSALAMETDRSVIANIRKRNLISDETAIKLADLLNIDRTELLIAAALARSTGEVKDAWLRASRQAGIAAGWLFFVAYSLTPGILGDTFCILC